MNDNINNVWTDGYGYICPWCGTYVTNWPTLHSCVTKTTETWPYKLQQFIPKVENKNIIDVRPKPVIARRDADGVIRLTFGDTIVEVSNEQAKELASRLERISST